MICSPPTLPIIPVPNEITNKSHNLLELQTSKVQQSHNSPIFPPTLHQNKLNIQKSKLLLWAPFEASCGNDRGPHRRWLGFMPAWEIRCNTHMILMILRCFLDFFRRLYIYIFEVNWCLLVFGYSQLLVSYCFASNNIQAWITFVPIAGGKLRRGRRAMPSLVSPAHKEVSELPAGRWLPSSTDRHGSFDSFGCEKMV